MVKNHCRLAGAGSGFSGPFSISGTSVSSQGWEMLIFDNTVRDLQRYLFPGVLGPLDRKACRCCLCKRNEKDKE